MILLLTVAVGHWNRQIIILLFVLHELYYVLREGRVRYNHLCHYWYIFILDSGFMGKC